MRTLLTLLLAAMPMLAFEYDLTPSKVNVSTYCFFGKPEVMDTHNNGNMSNSCFVDMGTGYLVIDSGPTYLYAKQAYALMKKIKNLPISHVINTHTHDDHWLGNAYYKEIGVNIIGSKEFKNEVKPEKTRMQMRISKEAYAGTEQIFPNIFVDNKKVLELDGKKVTIESVNKKAHTNSDLFVYIPEYSTLFAGDLVFNERIPSIRDGNINNWIEALDTIKAMNVKYIIGGHGEIVDKTSVDATYKYLTQLKEKISSAMEEGEDLDDAVNSITMVDFRNFKMYDGMHRQNVAIAYRMLEWEQ